jgi:DNA-binding NtrC family response regulator
MIFKKSKKRILVADDDQDFLSVTRAVLEFAGFRVDTVEDGKQALKEIKRRKYDMLIIDVIMPKIGGVKLFQTVKKSKRHAKIPVIFISGHPVHNKLGPQIMEIVEKADAFLEKPFKSKVLLETVRKLLEKQTRPTTRAKPLPPSQRPPSAPDAARP